MNEFIVSTGPELNELGAMRVLAGTLKDEKSYHRGSEELFTPGGIDYDLQLTNTGKAILLTGTASCVAHTRCARCLKPVEIDICGDVEGYYVLKGVNELDGYEKDEFDCIDEHGNFDIAGPIEAALVIATDFIILCKPDCAGLCPKCGADLNEGLCDCQSEDIDPLNPFAALKNFKFDDT